MAAVERALVIGAGIGGLGAGAALAGAGIETDVVEIQPEPNVYGVGINQPGNSLRALDRLGVLEEVLSVGFQFDGWDFHDAEGTLIVGVDSHLADDRVPHNNGLSRRDLHTILIGAAERAGAVTRYGTTVTDVTCDGDGAHVGFSDGSHGSYDVVAAFDGIRSPQRGRLFTGIGPSYSGVVIWRVTVPRPAEATRGALFQAAGAKAGWCPLSQDSMYLFLVTPEPRDVRIEKGTAPALLRERLAPFGGHVGEIREALTDADDVVYSPLNEVMLPDPWHRERVVVCGDAAHACAPHLTQGAAMALEDAVVLADELRAGEDVEAALKAFSARRHPRAKFVQDASRGVLDAEMSITAETLPYAFEGMRAHLPEQAGAVDAFLSQPA